MKTTLKDKAVSLFCPLLLKTQRGRGWLVRHGGIPVCYVQKHWREMVWRLVAGHDLLCVTAIDALGDIWDYTEDGYRRQTAADCYWDAHDASHPEISDTETLSGWKWHDYSDGTGALLTAEGEVHIIYDLDAQTYLVCGGGKWHNMNLDSGIPYHISREEFKEMAEQMVLAAMA